MLTVSPAYAQELLAGELESFGLLKDINGSVFQGIRNGIDVDIWNPQQDKLLPETMRYSVENVGEKKDIVKMALQVQNA